MKLRVIIQNFAAAAIEVCLNGKTLIMTRRKTKGFTSTYECLTKCKEGENTLEFYTHNEMTYRGFLYALLMWFVGLFGLFTPRFETSPTGAYFKMTFYSDVSEEDGKESEGQIELKLNAFKPEISAAQILNLSKVHDQKVCENNYFLLGDASKKAKKYNKLMNLGTFLSIVAAIVLFLIMNNK